MQLIKANHMSNNMQLVLAKIEDRANYGQFDFYGPSPEELLIIALIVNECESK